MKRSATIVWTAIAVACGTGCIPIYTPIVEQDVTTGEKLRAIAAKRESLNDGSIPPQNVAQVDAQYQDLRARVLRHPPSMRASINDWELKSASSYRGTNPGLYSPVDHERADLKRARDAGVLSAEEFAELDAMLTVQAQRTIVRRSFEWVNLAVAGTVRHRSFLESGYYESYSEGACARYLLESWIPRQLEMVRGKQNYSNPNVISNYSSDGAAIYMDPAESKSRSAPASGAGNSGSSSPSLSK